MTPDWEHSVAPELAAEMHEAIARLFRRLRGVELPAGLTHERLSTLGSIRTREPVSLSHLAEIELVSSPTMSRMIAALEEEGFVRRRHDKMDGRGVLLLTTAKGRRVYQRAVEQSLSQLINTLDSLEPEQLAAVQALFSALSKKPQD